MYRMSPIVRKECPTCNKAFERKESKKRVYCSTYCYGISKRKHTKEVIYPPNYFMRKPYRNTASEYRGLSRDGEGAYGFKLRDQGWQFIDDKV